MKTAFSLGLLTIVTIACSGSGLTGSAPPRAVVSTRFDVADKNDCSVAGAAFDVGLFKERPDAIDDGTVLPSGVVRIVCKVVDLGDDRLSVDGSLRLDDRVVFAIKGTFPTERNVNGFPAERVTVSNGLAGPDYAVFTQADGTCHVLYQYEAQGTAGGRVWATVSCAKATKDETLGGSGSGTCISTTQFRFENCAFE